MLWFFFLLANTGFLYQIVAGKESARDDEELDLEALGENVAHTVLSSQGLHGRLRAFCASHGISDIFSLEHQAEIENIGAEPGEIFGITSGVGQQLLGLMGGLMQFARDIDEMETLVQRSRPHISVSLRPPGGAAAAAAAAAAEAISVLEGRLSDGDAAFQQQERERSFYMRFYPHVFRFFI